MCIRAATQPHACKDISAHMHVNAHECEGTCTKLQRQGDADESRMAGDHRQVAGEHLQDDAAARFRQD